jgi:Fic family protein
MSVATPPFSLEAQREVFFSTSATSDAVSYAVRTGKARKLGPRLYTKAMSGDPADICRRNWPAICSGYFPGAVIVGRTAMGFKPAEDGSVFLAVSRTRDVRLPGLRLRARRGPGRLDGDLPFMGVGLFMSSRARAFLENLQPSRARAGAVTRTLRRVELEDALVEFGRYDESSLGRLRDEARALAPDLGAEGELEQLDALIGALLRTRDIELSGPLARAAARGTPWDPARIDRFEQLAARLLASGLADVPAQLSADISVLAFYEAYFSNYIEGTEFTLDEAREIIFGGLMPPQRPKDAHDILGTYRLVSDGHERVRVPGSADELIAVLQDQHRAMLRERPEVGPGRLKERNNHVGGREFVDHRLVEGTLREAFRLYASLPKGFARAAFAMFLVAEVHPFADGNGRTARLLMNSELSAASQQRIVITTRDRGDYLAALRGMTNQLNIPAYLTVLTHLQRRTGEVDFSSLSAAEQSLRADGALTDTDEGQGLLGGAFSVAGR